MTTIFDTVQCIELFQTHNFGKWMFPSSDVREKGFLLSWTRYKVLVSKTGTVTGLTVLSSHVLADTDKSSETQCLKKLDITVNAKISRQSDVHLIDVNFLQR
jgi:hypothetical protein